jgi:hypothetical protein
MLFGFERPLPERRGLAVEHEGDWERVDVLLQRGGRRDVYVPVAVGLGVRGVRRDIPWGDFRLAGGRGPAATFRLVLGQDVQTLPVALVSGLPIAGAESVVGLVVVH